MDYLHNAEYEAAVEKTRAARVMFVLASLLCEDRGETGLLDWSLARPHSVSPASDTLPLQLCTVLHRTAPYCAVPTGDPANVILCKSRQPRHPPTELSDPSFPSSPINYVTRSRLPHPNDATKETKKTPRLRHCFWIPQFLNT